MTTTVRRFGKLILFGMFLLALVAWPVAAWSKDGKDDGDDHEGVTVNVTGGVNANVGVTTGGSNPSGSTGGSRTTTPSSPTTKGGTSADGPPAFSREVDAKTVSG